MDPCQRCDLTSGCSALLLADVCNIHPVVFQDLFLKSMFPNHTGEQIQQLIK